MNYLLGQLEARDYIERRAERGSSSRRLVFLTNRGWQVRETIFAVVTALRRSGLRFSVSDVSTNA
jgi:DNA-binding MarR family transcriptional regulator